MFFEKYRRLADRQGSLDDRIEVLKLNVGAFLKAWIAYDSLGKTYAKKGNIDLVVENLEMSLEINPKTLETENILLEFKRKTGQARNG